MFACATITVIQISEIKSNSILTFEEMLILTTFDVCSRDFIYFHFKYPQGAQSSAYNRQPLKSQKYHRAN